MSLEGVARTAWYCCGVRAADARRAKPLCGDTLAERFMTDEGRAVWRRFEALGPANITNAARHRVVDDWLRERFAAEADAPVLLLGAGFDTRAFRLPGGRWLEVDQPALIALKEQLLPAAGAPQPLQRLAIDFGSGSLAELLAPWRGTPGVTVVMEGVSMYLDDDALRGTAQALRQQLPGHRLICDLLDARFLRRFGGPMRLAVRSLGGEFAPPREDPAATVAALGYRLRRQRSVAQAAVDLGGMPALFGAVLRTPLLAALREGYRLFEFEALPGAA